MVALQPPAWRRRAGTNTGEEAHCGASTEQVTATSSPRPPHGTLLLFRFEGKSWTAE